MRDHSKMEASEQYFQVLSGKTAVRDVDIQMKAT